MKIENQDLLREAATVSRMQQAISNPEFSFSNSIQLVAEVNPKLLRRVDIVRNLSTAALSGVSGKRFVITAVSIAYSKSAADNGTSLQCSTTLGGSSRIVARISTQTLTAESRNVFFAFPVPIVCDEGQGVSRAIGGAFTAEAVEVYGYFIEA